MRGFWWIPFIAASSLAQVQAQTAAPAQAGQQVVPRGLQVAPQLREHRNLQEEEMSVFLVGDDLSFDGEGKMVLQGGAQVRRIDSVVKGDRIEYDRDSGQVKVRGNGLMMRDASIVVGPEIDYNLNSETGEVTAPDFWLGGSGGAGTAERAEILSQQHMRLYDMRYSGCPCPDPAWYITSSRVDLKFDENEGVARNGVLYFKGVPILASPWLTFPITKDRKSGFLVPTYGMTSKSGVEFSLPYYFNLAPNYDFTLTPHYYSKRGLQLGGEFRYLGRGYSGIYSGAYLNNDKEADRKRWTYRLQHTHRLGGGFSAGFDVRRVSDDNYHRDFTALGLGQSQENSLPSHARLNWSGYNYFSAGLRVQTYQTLQDTDLGYYRRPEFDKLPELTFRGARYGWNNFDVVSENSVTKFRMPLRREMYRGVLYDLGRAGTTTRQAPDGTRFSSYTSIAYPIVKAGWYVTPKAGLHMSQYSTDWYKDELGPRYSSFDRTHTRVLPILSLDSGMTFERDTTLFGNDSIQTLEPRLYYLYVPYRDQSMMPVYDTSLATFNFAQAFDENIYSGGWDRIAEANQVTFGLTSRWLDADTGFERLSLSAAQRLYFNKQQRVTLSPGQVKEEDLVSKRSDYLVGVNAALTDNFSVRFDAQFNPETRDRNRMAAGIRWEPKRLASVSLSYRYERDPRAIADYRTEINPEDDRAKEYMTFSGQWPLSNKIYAMGRFDYSLQEKRNTQSILGFEYKGDCCWVARVVAQRYAVSAKDVNTAFFLQLELTGLGSLGTDPMGLLRERVIGYEPVTHDLPEKTTFERYE
ncbi:LPS-assembly protein LptD [Paracandidimonas soli]|uniref:LPS-assembly protein LptD n=1 Tax=Paracandidimonas soli TaxID=1917182 RepID=UPI00334113EB